MSGLMSQRAYAAHRNVSHTAVQKAIKAGRITLVNGKIDAVQADRDWEVTTAPHQTVLSATPKPGVSQGAEPPITGGANYQQARAVREGYLARLARLDFEQKNRKLIDIDEVKVLWFKLISETKTKLLGVGSKAKQHIPHLSMEEISIIDRLQREALEELAECPLSDQI